MLECHAVQRKALMELSLQIPRFGKETNKQTKKTILVIHHYNHH